MSDISGQYAGNNPMRWTGPERRRDRRYAIGPIPCTIYLRGKEYPAIVESVSARGLRVSQVPREARCISSMTVAMLLRGIGVFVATAHVRNQRATDGGYSLGVEIEPVSEVHERRLAAFLQGVQKGRADIHLAVHCPQRPGSPPVPPRPPQAGPPPGIG